MIFPDLKNRKTAFAELGRRLVTFKDRDANPDHPLEILIRSATNYNPWFTEDNMRNAVVAAGESLDKDKIERWLQPYYKSIERNNNPKTVGVVMAGNIPGVGFHDFISVLMSGNYLLGKLSSDDNKVLPVITDMLSEINGDLGEFVTFTEDKLSGFDAVIATGSNNTSRYFQYYFGKYPNIIRMNRNGVAVLNGNETAGELELLANDIFLYFGMGCRSVSKLFVPEGYDFQIFFNAVTKYQQVINHHKYKNNYDYFKSIYLINKTEHLDNGFLLLKEDVGYASPPSVLFFEYYGNTEEVKNRLITDSGMIQCVVGDTTVIPDILPFGNTQKPELWDYADGVDTMEFLLSL